MYTRGFVGKLAGVGAFSGRKGDLRVWEANKEVGKGCVCCRMIGVPRAGGGIVCNCESSLDR